MDGTPQGEGRMKNTIANAITGALAEVMMDKGNEG